MAYFQNDDLEYVVNDCNGDVVEFKEDNDALADNHPCRSLEVVDDDSGNDDDFEDDLDSYREARLKQYKNYESLGRPRQDLEKECLQVEKGKSSYDFHYNTRLVRSTIVHFQLRNLLWATSKHDVCLMQNFSVMRWNFLHWRGTEVLNVATPIVPTEKRPGLLARRHDHSLVQISTMAVKKNLLVAGGFQGELICKHMKQPGVAFCSKLTTDETAITNAVDIFQNPTGSMRVMTANNDAQVRVFDIEKFACLNRFSFEWSVNNTSVGPDGKLLAVLGDSADCLIAAAQSGKAVGDLKGHLDYCFSSAWHPDGRIFATGNQDTTCRLWDIRNLSESLAVLKGRMGAIRAIKFTSDGRFMAMAEPADFVYIIDTQSGYAKRLICLVRLPEYPSAPTLKLCFLGLLIAHMVVYWSPIRGTIIPIKK
ncbi:hypothetical protein ABKV19_014641 [Rosa sericea]